MTHTFVRTGASVRTGARGFAPVGCPPVGSRPETVALSEPPGLWEPGAAADFFWTRLAFSIGSFVFK